MKITRVEIHDVRFPTSKDLSGSDAVHKSPDYSCVYIVLNTDDAGGLKGYGLTFTLGRGNEVVKKCAESLRFLFQGKDFDKDILRDMMDKENHRGFYYQLTQEGQLRWLGPEKGVLALAYGAYLNAVWDLMSRRAGKPLWEFVADMEPSELIEYIDFKHIEDFVTKEEGLEFLRRRRKGWEERKKRMREVGFRAYTTSAGWLGYPVEKVKKLCRECLSEGHRYFKMKIGSPKIEDDIARAQAIRDTIGEENFLMMDANQKYGVRDAIVNMKLLAKFNPLWIEEPTNCDDVVGHARIADELFDLGIGVATGEVAHSKVMFKQLLQQPERKRIKYCQIDSCRVAGVSEVLSILLMAAKAGVKVCPHAGGVGLCEYVRHLAMIDFVVFNPKDELDRICESTSHLHEHFHDEVRFNKSDDGLFYRAPVLPGYAVMRPESLKRFEFPSGSEWRKTSKTQERVHSSLNLGVVFLIGAVIGYSVAKSF